MRAEFEQACIPYEDTGPNKVGFTSGEVDVATTSNNVGADPSIAIVSVYEQTH